MGLYDATDTSAIEQCSRCGKDLTTGVRYYEDTFPICSDCMYKPDTTMYGWMCPRCERVNAPWIPSCDCCVRSTTSGTYTFSQTAHT